jgi:hypothetical protein
MPVINKAKRMRWEDHEFEASLGYTLARHWWLTPVILATQEDGGLNPGWANSSQDSIAKKPFTKKRASGVAQGVGPQLKPQYHKKKKKKPQRMKKLEKRKRKKVGGQELSLIGPWEGSIRSAPCHTCPISQMSKERLNQDHTPSGH